MKPKDYIQNEEEIKVVELRGSFMALLTLARFTCFFYYLDKMSQVVDFQANSVCLCTCTYAEIFFFLPNLSCALEETKCKPHED